MLLKASFSREKSFFIERYGTFQYFFKEKKERLNKDREKTKTSFFSKFTKAVAGKSTVDSEVLDNLEEILDFLRCGRKYHLKDYPTT